MKLKEWNMSGEKETTIGIWNGKPIEWLILDEKENEALLVSKHVIDCGHYHDGYDTVTWETCSLRKWLNTHFLEAAFTEEERARILETELRNDDNPINGKTGGNNTRDKVFLLSLEEAKRYFPNNEARRCKPTAYAAANGTYVGALFGTCYWWLRSPGGDGYGAACVLFGGGVDTYGVDVNSGSIGVRPAMWMRKEGNNDREKEVD